MKGCFVGDKGIIDFSKGFKHHEGKKLVEKLTFFYQKEDKIGSHTNLLGLPAAERTTAVWNALQAQTLLCWN